MNEDITKMPFKHIGKDEAPTTLVKEGKYAGMTKKEFNRNLKQEKLINRTSQAKTFKGYLIASAKVARSDNNPDLAMFIDHLMQKYNEFESRSKVKLRGWKGKSGISIIKRPDSINVTTYQKSDQDHEPEEITKELTRQDLNSIIVTFNHFKKGEKIDTKDLAAVYCRVCNINFDDDKRAMFNDNGEFVWKNFFAWRSMHIKFNMLLRVLDKLEIIKYRGHKSEILTEEVDIQEILNV